MVKFNPVSHLLPFWERDRGTGPLTELLKRREVDRDKPQSPLAFQDCIEPRPMATQYFGDGNRWVSKGEK